MCTCTDVLLYSGITVVALAVFIAVYFPDPDMTQPAPDIDKSRMANSTAFIVGHTGEIGKQLMRSLLESKVFKNLVLIGRREIDDPLIKENADRVSQKVVNFDDLSSHADAFAGCDVGFCCLGTTRGKSGKDGFIKVDHDYVLNTAQVAKSQGVQHFNLVSSAGSNANAFFLYPKTKGQVENEIADLKFDRFTIYRPAMLLYGPEGRTEQRTGEKVAITLMKPLIACKPTLASVPTLSVAKAMIWQSVAAPAGDESKKYVENAELHQLAAFYDQKLTA